MAEQVHSIRHQGINGIHVRLKPLQISDADNLFTSLCGSGNDGLWDYMPSGPFGTREDFTSYIARCAGSTDPLFWCVIDQKSQLPVGYASLMRIDESNRVIEVGNIMYSQSLQKTVAATESWFLLADKAFSSGFRRLEWKCNALNLPSRRAALRYGHKFEGVFRQHMIVKGRNRDTAWYSILDHEWPIRQLALQKWMRPHNFDDNGCQKANLVSIRNELEGQQGNEF
ncbi:acyl-CoA N-acyltransferase [Polychaeton citri CBS 116435]|uniref:Acyl-CoA N-acyltransferase n=1 Tax=Polychaeton citri CBS 116435 TaxID=1314669 RepID=A0A9P4PVU7_9PEZI|nr:acyl-CoA N-acyltransferase [Polychaeton citri CBS 116435]